MLSNQVLGSPGITNALVGHVAYATFSSWQNLILWWHASGKAETFRGIAREYSPAGQRQEAKGWDGKGAPARPRPTPTILESKEDREFKISRVKIFPGDVTIETGQQAIFNAVAYDRDGAPISGLEVSWDGLDEDGNQPFSVSRQAAFSSNKPGKFKLTADIGGRKDQVKVTVVGERRSPNIVSSTAEPVSSSDRPRRISSIGPVNNGNSRIAQRRGGGEGNAREGFRASAKAFAPGAAMFFLPGEDDYGWNSANYTTIDDPGKERGDIPGHAIDGGAGSGNFQFEAPLIGLDGRGIDLNMAFNYNSRLWHKSGTDMYFDVDRDWIPGWIMGFGKIVMAGTSYIMIDADGTRHPFSGLSRGSFPSPYSSLQTFEAYTTDGSFINYYAEGYKAQFDNSGGHNMRFAWAKLSNGTTIEYGAPANYAVYPKKITDANGNYITITYRTYTRYWNNQWVYGVEEGPNIETITDTLGRTIQFHYERSGTAPNEKDLLTAVTAPGFNGGASRVIVRLQYDSRNLNNAGANYGFQSWLAPRVRDNGIINVIKAIYYPATGTGYWFGDGDSYSNYGMLRKVSERRAMTCTAAGGGSCSSPAAGLAQQPSIGAGSMSREMVYLNPNQPGYSSLPGPLGDVPTFTQMTEDWAGRDTAAAPVTKYSVEDLGTTRRSKMVRPDGVRIEQDTNNDPNSLYYGLLIEDRTYPDETSQNPVHRSTVAWYRTGDPAQDPNNTDPTYRSPRPARTEVFDDRGQMTATDYSYGAYYNQVVSKTEYGYGGSTRLHSVYSDYENGALYRGDWIYRGTLWFDGGTYPNWSGPHLFNLTRERSIYAADGTTRVAHTSYRYDEYSLVARTDAGQLAPAPAQRGNLTAVKRYANAGSLDEATAAVETRNYDACGNVVTQTTACCQQTSFEFNVNTRYGWPALIRGGSPTDTTKQNQTGYSYDLNTGLLVSSTDANGNSAVTNYQALTLRPEWEYSPTGAYAYHIYDDANLVVYDFAYENGQSGASFASRSDKYLDTHGRVRGEIAYGKDYVLDYVRTMHDNLGRLWQQSRPYRATPDMTVYEYDKLDRVTKITCPTAVMSNASITRRAIRARPPQARRARPCGRGIRGDANAGRASTSRTAWSR